MPPYGTSSLMWIVLFGWIASASGQFYNITFLTFGPNYSTYRSYRPFRPAYELIALYIKDRYPQVADYISIISLYYENTPEDNCLVESGSSTATLPFFQHYFKYVIDREDDSSFIPVLFPAFTCAGSVVEEIASFSRETNVPVVSGEQSDALNIPEVFPNVLNLNPSPISMYLKAILALSQRYKWSKIGYVCRCPSGSSACQESGAEEGALQPLLCDYLTAFTPNLTASREFSLVLRYLTTDGSSPDYSVLDDPDLLSCRVIVVLLETRLRDFMINAYARGMADGEYVFLAVGVMLPPESFAAVYSPSRGDDFDKVASEAFRSLVIIFEAGVDWESPDVKSFIEESDQLNRELYNMSTTPAEMFVTPAFLTVEYLLLIADALNQTSDWTPLLATPLSILDFALNKTYNLISGTYNIDKKGFLSKPVPIKRFSELSQSFETALWYYQTSFDDVGRFTPVGKDAELWFGKKSLPPDREECELDVHGISCFWLHHPGAKDGVISCGVVLIVLLALYGIYRRHHSHRKEFNHLFLDKWTEVNLHKLATRTSSHSTTFARRNETALGIWAAFNDVDAFAKNIKSKITMRDARHNKHFTDSLLTVHGIKHRNVAEFYGVTFQSQECYLLSAFSQRGSLATLVNSTELLSDITFRLHFIRDIVEGLHEIHLSPLKYHGNFGLPVVLVDNRFTCQVAQAGYQHMADSLNKVTYEGNSHEVSEQAKDIRQFSVALEELTSNSTTNRTDSPVNNDVSTKLHILVEQCQLESEWQRPRMPEIRQVIRPMIAKNSSIVELLIATLGKHAESLQHVVGDRTAALVEETRKVDELLEQMLPRLVIRQLRNHETVQAEFFDNATVLFSDIPSFADVVQRSTPLMVVDFLNAVYSKLDGTLAQRDVYKVETINDSYVVVSGIPIPNGLRHTFEICSLALELLHVTEDLTVSQRDDSRVHLRIGINSGPIAAGLVGTRMPRYCLFGDAMNTASRMESHGAANKIQVSKATYDFITVQRYGSFKFEDRGLVEIKGKGKLQTY